EGAAGRMRRLIDDLLSFSRVTSHARPFGPVSLSEILTDVVCDLEVRIEQTGGTVEVGPLPEIDADPSQMRQLFQNLVANALKFHRPEVAPVVRVRGELVPAAAADPTEPWDAARSANGPAWLCRVTVEDNG